MEIIFDGQQTREEIVEQMAEILNMFDTRYQINNFREMHITLTLVDRSGEDVELVDSNTAEVYRYFEAHSAKEAPLKPRSGKPCLKLVVDNSRR